jgi:hypothetical protein
MKRYAYGWITVLFFLVSIAGHWLFGWYAFCRTPPHMPNNRSSPSMRCRWGATPSRTAIGIPSAPVAGSGPRLPVRRLTSLEGK